MLYSSYYKLSFLTSTTPNIPFILLFTIITVEPGFIVSSIVLSNSKNNISLIFNVFYWSANAIVNYYNDLI